MMEATSAAIRSPFCGTTSKPMPAASCRNAGSFTVRSKARRNTATCRHAGRRRETPAELHAARKNAKTWRCRSLLTNSKMVGAASPATGSRSMLNRTRICPDSIHCRRAPSGARRFARWRRLAARHRQDDVSREW
jgi:hypothetical protein